MQNLLRVILLSIVFQFTVIVSKGQCPGNGNMSPVNLIVNGDFSSGNSGFASSYSYCNTNNCLFAVPPNGEYAIGGNPSFFHSNFVGFDHTTGTGNLFIANGATLPNTDVWCQTVFVQTNKTYVIRAWVANMINGGPPANLEFKINGNSIGSIVTPMVHSQWVQFTATWNSGGSSTALLCIVDNQLAGSGNDFGLDDISINECISCNLTVTATADTSICIGNNVQLNASANKPASYSWSPATGLSNPNIANPVAFPTSTTTYTVTATDSAGCTGQKTVKVTVNPLPGMNASANTDVCRGDSVLLIALGVGNLTYNWSPGNTLSCTNCQGTFAKPTQNTTYTITATSQQGCTKSDSVTVTVLPNPVIDAGNDVYLCNANSTQLNASYVGLFIPSVSWSPANSLNSSVVLNPTASPTTTTTYTLTLTNTQTGCSSIDSVTVYLNAVAVNVSNDTIICKGGTASLNASFNLLYTYQWSPANLVSNPNSNQVTTSPNTTTIFTLTVTDTNNCVGTYNIKVQVNNPPPINAGPDSSICSGESITLAGSGGSNLIWESDPTLSCTVCPSPVATPVNSQWYYLSGTDSIGCSNKDSVFITVNSKPNIQVSANDTVCTGKSKTLIATGATGYLWKPAQSLSCTTCPNPVASPQTNTTYTVTGTNNSGCTDSNMVTVFVKPNPAITIAADTAVCLGGTANLWATGGSNFQWSPGNSLSCNNCPNPVATPNATMTYTVVIADQLGCQTKDSVKVSVTQFTPLSINGDSTVCVGDTVSWTAIGGNTYQWAPNKDISCVNCANPKLYPKTTTTYTLTGTGLNGCAGKTISKTITVNTLPVSQIAKDDTICSGDSISIWAAGGVAYNWAPSMGLSCINCANPTASPNATTQYSVTIFDQNSCKSDTFINIRVNQPPTINVSPNTSVCIGDTVQVSGSGGISQLWSPAVSLSCNSCTNPFAFPLQTTIYTLTVFDQKGCWNKDSVKVEVFPLPQITVSNDTLICAGETVQINASGGQSYQWSPGTGLSCTSCNSPVASPATKTTYTVTVLSVNNCENKDSVSIRVSPLPVIQISNDTSICEGKSISLSASGGVQYSWSPPNSLDNPSIPKPVAAPQTSTTYTVVVFNADNCMNTDSVTVTVNTLLNPDAGTDTIICPGDSVQLFAKNGISYQWSPSQFLDNENTANPLAFPDVATVFTVQIIDLNGCPNSGQVQVDLFPQPVADAGTDQTIFIGQPVQLTGNGGIQFYWQPAGDFADPNQQNPSVQPLTTTVYTLTTTDENQCKAMDTVRITVDKPTELIMPNAFTPNGDGRNDVFGIGNPYEIQTIDFKIFDRWGNNVFQTNDPFQVWDGNYLNRNAGIGTYVYQIKGISITGFPIDKKGNLTLIR
jgi:gliding motility-associated-like protein